MLDDKVEMMRDGLAVIERQKMQQLDQTLIDAESKLYDKDSFKTEIFEQEDNLLD